VSARLSSDEADRAVAERGLGWRREGGAIVKEEDRGDFAGALAFVNRVGELAEGADHHPDVDIRWGRVTLRLSTHSAGGLTVKDLELAAAIDALDR
jgi:4a-hydroxytetrahydrobiopterin dehydratase